LLSTFSCRLAKVEKATIDKNSVSVKVNPHEIITFGIKLDKK